MGRVRIRLAGIALVLWGVALGTGCGNSYRVDPIYVYNKEDGRSRADLDHNLKPLNLEEYRFPEVQYRLEQDYKDRRKARASDSQERFARRRYPSNAGGGLAGTSVYPTAYEQAVADQAMRNRLMDILIGRSQRQFEVHISMIIAGQSSINLGLDTVTMTTAGLAAVFTPPVTTTALATTAALTEGFQSAFNERIYLNFLAPRIISEMTQSRAAHYSLLQQHKLLPIDVYSVDSMLAEIETYHQKGSFLHGIMRLGTEDEDAVQMFRSTVDMSKRSNDEVTEIIEESLKTLRAANIEIVSVTFQRPTGAEGERKPGEPLWPLKIEVRERRLLPQTEQSYKAHSAAEKAELQQLRKDRIRAQVLQYVEQQFELGKVECEVRLADEPEPAEEPQTSGEDRTRPQTVRGAWFAM